MPSVVLGAAAVGAQELTPVRLRVTDPEGLTFRIALDKVGFSVSEPELRALGGAAALQVRLFRGSPSEVVRRRPLPGEECVSLNTVVLGLEPRLSGVVLAAIGGAFLMDARWLSQKADGTFGGETYTVVFERRNTSMSGVVKVKKEDLENYLRWAWQFGVRSDGPLAKDETRVAVEWWDSVVRTAAPAPASTIECFRLHSISADLGTAKFGSCRCGTARTRSVDTLIESRSLDAH